MWYAISDPSQPSLLGPFPHSLYNAAVIILLWHQTQNTPSMDNGLANLVPSLALHVYLHDELTATYKKDLFFMLIKEGRYVRFMQCIGCTSLRTLRSLRYRFVFQNKFQAFRRGLIMDPFRPKCLWIPWAGPTISTSTPPPLQMPTPMYWLM